MSREARYARPKAEQCMSRTVPSRSITATAWREGKNERYTMVPFALQTRQGALIRLGTKVLLPAGDRVVRSVIRLSFAGPLLAGQTMVESDRETHVFAGAPGCG